MATAAAAAKGAQRIHLQLGRQGQGRQDRARRNARGRREHGQATLRRQGITVSKVKKQKRGGGGIVGEKDIALFTRQMATMMKAGVPLLQSFDIVGKGATNPAVAKAADRHQDRGRDRLRRSPQAFRKYPLHFDALYCNLVARRRAGRHSGDAARPPRDLQGKDARHQVEDQVGAVLPGRRSSWSRSSSPR